MNRTYFFVGPSLPDAAGLVDPSVVGLRPPVGSGDLLALPAEPGDSVVIADGYFHHVRAVRHKEILALMARGVRVWGGASMGALRAAELAPFGMTGVGRIFEGFRDGTLEADDEVTLVHAPAEEGYRRLSEPLVNLRATLTRAVTGGRCTPDEAEAVVTGLAGMPYQNRALGQVAVVARRAGIDPLRAGELADLCRRDYVDLKRADTLELLAAATAPDPGPAPPPVRVNETIHLHQWRVAHGDPGGAAHGALRVCQLLDPEYPRVHEQLVIRFLAGCAGCARAAGERVVPGLLAGPAREADRGVDAAILHAEHTGILRLGGAGLPSCVERWTSAEERRTLGVRELLTAFLVRSFRLRPGLPPDALALPVVRARPFHREAERVWRRAAELNRLARTVRPEFEPGRLPARVVLPWLAELWHRAPDDLELAALDRGFADLRHALDAARTVYLAVRHGGPAPHRAGEAATG
ncbi:TfuA-like protein [Streptomyces sp. NPDC052721]|uniref:TfuA-like protein n=1 Tax=Streptomyces sp. NPDC052721 TaxID=3154955 RepID=UPI00344AA1B7